MRRIRPLLPPALGLVALLTLVMWASAGAGESRAGASPLPPVTFHCTWDASCPEVTVAGDPPALLGGGPAPFRGYGDPSLERDPLTGALWMSYSWLDVLVSDPGPPPVVDFGVRTHLARSDDGGATFTFVREVNQTVATVHPDNAEEGWTMHEVSTLVREAAGGWQTLWLTYFDPFGAATFYDVYYSRSVAGAPGQLGDAVQPWIRGAATSSSFAAQYNLSAIPQLSDCAAFTEPALLAHEGATYLATNCVVYGGGVRRDDLERLVLLRQEANGYTYIGEMLDYADAQDFAATRIEQADLAIARNGAILLIATPIQNSTPYHQGCVVFEVADIASAQVRRDDSGDAVQLAHITGDDATVGPGLCTYDAASETGLMMVLHSVQPAETVFSLRATGVHPTGLDTDADGVADSADACPADPDCDGDGFADGAEGPCGSDPMDAGKRPERLDLAGDDDGDGDLNEALPGGASGLDCDGDGWTGAQEALIFGTGGTVSDQDSCGNNGWPADLDPNNVLSIGDLNSFIFPNGPDDGHGTFAYFGHTVPDAGRVNEERRDLDPNGVIDIGNINALNPMVTAPSARPPMFGGQPAFFAGACPWPP